MKFVSSIKFHLWFTWFLYEGHAHSQTKKQMTLGFNGSKNTKCVLVKMLEKI